MATPIVTIITAIGNMKLGSAVRFGSMLLKKVSQGVERIFFRGTGAAVRK
jgi:hypothetical protein